MVEAFDLLFAQLYRTASHTQINRGSYQIEMLNLARALLKGFM